ncbi:zinc finger family protein [Arabidopsis lyrata subsp. lyrata]|uniref:Zinc finger family protein n=1 Tax=Arabidopsis lyrata subsp. lyrata TaxID=81972 RepID=D7MPX3_ARALL|nr:GATA transcription factor 27 isoform X1 [Arabidopsis lyrata subsp. lyrata]EFH41398.1 zinc finger family protein [Arabidopsis lyrata subsp. lyrata]|eukprot:XP_002865139.1 GATA transcription factor 27 isoform X1 [Arabidopsis lyrata subsp. lyrata]
MGKQGPCYHCGVTSTPLWRNGPPEKPVLCNACGSRWRTKGSLVNYTPLHARAEGDEIEIEDHRAQRVMIKGMSLNKKILKRKPYQENFTVKRANLEFHTGFKRKVLDEEASNRSSSGSVVSNSESCAQSNAWDATFPCKRRTCVGRPKAASSVEKLTKDLYTILQEQQSSCLSGTSEEDLLFESETPMLLGHGSVLMRDPHPGAREEESEASSLLVESSKSSSVHSVKFGGKAIKQEQLKRSKSQVLGRHSSLLCSIDLKDVFNFDEFIEKFTEEEQQKLMKLLPQVDSVDRPDSLRSMFESSQFKENLSLFQQLVADGVFETTSSYSSGSKLEDIKTLAKLALSDPYKSHLLESYYMLKEQKKRTEDSVTTTSKVSNLSPSKNNSLVTIERPCESLNQNFSETRDVMRSPKEVMKIRSKHIETKEILENSVSSFKPMSCGGPLVFSYEDNDISDQDLLLDVPSNGSFPQAELLHMI